MVMEDAIFLAKKGVEKQNEMEVEENYYSYKKILDAESEDMKGMNIMENMLKVFHSQCSIRSKWVLTSSQFIKLSKLPGMTS